MKPPFTPRQLPALIDFICRFWRYPQAIEAPINFKESSRER